MVVNRRDLARLPTDYHQLEMLIEFNEVASIALLRKERVLSVLGTRFRGPVPLPNPFRGKYMPPLAVE